MLWRGIIRLLVLIVMLGGIRFCIKMIRASLLEGGQPVKTQPVAILNGPETLGAGGFAGGGEGLVTKIAKYLFIPGGIGAGIEAGSQALSQAAQGDGVDINGNAVVISGVANIVTGGIYSEAVSASRAVKLTMEGGVNIAEALSSSMVTAENPSDVTTVGVARDAGIAQGVSLVGQVSEHISDTYSEGPTKGILGLAIQGGTTFVFEYSEGVLKAALPQPPVPKSQPTMQKPPQTKTTTAPAKPYTPWQNGITHAESVNSPE